MPSYWDGVNSDSPNHRTHVAYPSGLDTGVCPGTHPERFITLFYEFLYDIASWDAEWTGDGKHPFVLSNGDPKGYGLHADFLSGWDEAVLRKVLRECTDPNGNLEACKAVDLHTSAAMDDCMVAPSIAAEAAGGWLARLPGCNPVQPGPGRAKPLQDCGAPAVIGAKEDYSTEVAGLAHVGCAL